MGFDLSTESCEDESWEVLNCLSEVNCGIFCFHRLLLKPWLTKEQGGLLQNVKWTVAVCWHHSTCGGAQDCSTGATVTDHWHWELIMLFEIHCLLTRTVLYCTVCTYALRSDTYCATGTYILRCNENTDTVSCASAGGWHLGNDESSWPYNTCLYFFDNCNFRGLHFALSFLFTTKRVLIHRFVISDHIEFYVCWQWLLKFCYPIKFTDTFLAADRLLLLVLTPTALPEVQSSQIYVLHNMLCSTGSDVLQPVPGVSTATASVLLCAVSQALLSGWCQHTLIQLSHIYICN